MMHPGAVLQHLEYIKSDHIPILLDTAYQDVLAHLDARPHRFEGKCLKEKDFRDVVHKAWEKPHM
jgi:hypothetical protein